MGGFMRIKKEVLFLFLPIILLVIGSGSVGAACVGNNIFDCSQHTTQSSCDASPCCAWNAAWLSGVCIKKNCANIASGSCGTCCDPGTRDRIVCGYQNKPDDHDEMDKFYCCEISGVTIDYGDTHEKDPVNVDDFEHCDYGYAMCGFKNSKNNDQLTAFHCCKIVEPVTLGAFRLADSDQDGGSAYGNSNEVAVRATNDQSVEDGVVALDTLHFRTITRNDGTPVSIDTSSRVLVDIAVPHDSKFCDAGSPPQPENTFPCDDCKTNPSKPGCAECCQCGDGTGTGTPSGGGGCFLAGTKITMSGGSLKNIEEIQIGDVVKAYDSENQRMVAGTVTKLFHHSPDEMLLSYYLIINNNLRVTPEHRVFTDKGLVWAKALAFGSVLIDENGEQIMVASIEKVYERVPTYNFEVEEYNTYFAEGFAVHNAKAIGDCGDGWCDPTEDSATCYQDCGHLAMAGPSPSLDFDLGSAITGFVIKDVSDCPNNDIIPQECKDIYTVHAGICGCGTKPAACHLRDQTTCQADSDCRWCEQPTDTINYPYAFPILNSTAATDSASCVNITWDVFNCGQCGFPGGGAPVTQNNKGFCPANKPYCVKGECKSKSQAKSLGWDQVYIPEELTDNGDFNPVYRYDVKSSGGAYYSEWYDNSGNVAGQTLPTYLLHDIGSNENICSLATGGSYSFDSAYGCCGDKKCYEKGGTVCNTGAICDGSQWHIASNTNQHGEVFLLDNCEVLWDNYPVANVEGTFVRCVDKDREGNYMAGRLIGTPICSPSYPDYEGQGIDPGIAGFMQYACSAGEYSVGGFRAMPDNTCAGHGQNVGDLQQSDIDVHYVCDLDVVDDTAFAFAYIVDTGGLGGNNVAPGIIGREGEDRSVVTYEQCPAGITSTWATGEDSMSTPAIVPCPGKLKVNPISFSNIYYYIEKPTIPRTWGWSLGRQYPTAGRTLQICRAPDPTDPTDTPGMHSLRTMKYVLGDGSSMGRVNDHEYVCYTDESLPPPDQDNGVRARIGICCGGDNCNGILGDIGSNGKKYYPGDYVNVSGNALYCLNNGRWSYDLDDETRQSECAAHFSATDTYCCSEGDDTTNWLSESYNDPNSSVGACFKGEPQYNDQYLKYKGLDYSNAFVSNGTFYGCGFNDSLFISEFKIAEDPGLMPVTGSVVASAPLFGITGFGVEDIPPWNDGPTCEAAGWGWALAAVGTAGIDYCDDDNINQGRTPQGGPYALICTGGGTGYLLNSAVGTWSGDNPSSCVNDLTPGKIIKQISCNGNPVPITNSERLSATHLGVSGDSSRIRLCDKGASSSPPALGTVPASSLSTCIKECITEMCHNTAIGQEQCNDLCDPSVQTKPCDMSDCLGLSSNTNVNCNKNPCKDCAAWCNVAATLCSGVCKPNHYVGWACYPPRPEQPLECRKCTYPIMHAGDTKEPLVFCEMINDSKKTTLCDLNASGRVSHACLQNVEDWPNPGTGCNDTRTGEPLIKETDYCTILGSSFGDVYCSYNNAWENTGGKNLSHKSVVPGPLLELFVNITQNPDLQPANCCEPQQCWDPSADGGQGKCIQPQAGATVFYQVNGTDRYQCLNGVWINVLGEGQRTPDNCYAGYCPESGQCLYDINGLPAFNNNVSPGAQPQCIKSGQYIGDLACVSGEWTTRTKLLAMKLASIVTNQVDDFVLMCAPQDEILINLQNFGATNNYCVLNYEGQRILGTTLNQPLYDPVTNDDFLTALEQSFLLSYPDAATLDLSGCHNADKFQRCVNHEYLKVYYDSTNKMIIFSDEEVYGLTPGFGQTICNLLPSWLKWLCPGPTNLEASLEDLQLFNKVYAAREVVATTSREVFGVAEHMCDDPLTYPPVWRYSFNYTGFSSADLDYLVRYVIAKDAIITQSQNHIFIKEPDPKLKPRIWTSLILLRNPEQE
ncbi:hypothetical protein AYK26_02550 [Euryarchaeota archaeon SM23-78]|nr:MAG: hypothetical protein AYK26_02550 [Euryarchaeota archaeon SM23-78]